jgi:hypothetical protein
VSAIGPIAVGLVILWLLATIAFQHAVFQRILGPWDVFKLLPSWSFFAPSPANRDSHIVVRDLHRDGALGAWSPVSRFPSRSLLHLIWHPEKRPRKILRDASKSIKTTCRRSASKGVVQCSLPYLVVLHYGLKRNPPEADVAARQFAIVETSGREKRRLWITFISDFHRI